MARLVYDLSWARSDPQPEKWRPMPARRPRETWASLVERAAKLYQHPHHDVLMLYQSLRRDHGMTPDVAARTALWAWGLVDGEE